MVDNYTGQGSNLFEQNIFSQIRQERTDFMYQFIQVVQGYPFNQYLNLKRIHLYLNSRFEDATQYNGRDKIFFNIVNYPCEVAAKNLNVDTKHIRLIPMNDKDGKTSFATFLLEKELQQWLKKSKFANILNQIADELPKYGSVVIEKTKDGADVIDLRRLINDQTVEKLQDSRFIDIVYYMTPSQLRDTGWDNVDTAIERFSQTNAPDTYEDQRGSLNLIRSTPYIKVIKRYGEVPQSWLDGSNSNKLTRALFICAGVDNVRKSELDGKTIVEEQGVVLFKSKWHKDWPFKDFHYNRIKGRWQGLGIVETLFDMQERMNEIKNQKRISMELSSIHLFQTQDKMFVKNALTDLRSGDILTSKFPINPVINEERNLPAFKDEEDSYNQHADRLSFAYEAARGEIPTNTTATAVVLSNQQATSVLAMKRENFTNILRDFFNDFVGENLLRDLTPEHIMRFAGSIQELDKLDMAAAEVYANDVILSKALNGEKVSIADQEEARQKAIDHYKKMGQNRFVKIKSNFYKDIEFEYDFNIANEQVDPNSAVQNTQVIFTALAQNPALLEDPRIKLLFFRYAEYLGVSPGELELVDNQAQSKRSALPSNIPQTNGTEQGQAGASLPGAKQGQANALVAQ